MFPLTTQQLKKHVLIFSPFFYPESISTGRYNTCLAQALVSFGLKLDVIASHPLFPAWVIQPSQASLHGMRIHRGGRWLFYPRSPLLRRALLELWFSIHAICFWLKFITSNTLLSTSTESLVVVPIFPPSLFFAILSLFLPSSISRVGIVHDLQGVYADKGGKAHRLIGRLIHSVERRAFQACDRLVFLSNSMMTRAIKSYALESSRCFVSHPFVTLSSSSSTSPAVDQALQQTIHNVVYSGALGDKQQPDLLLAFFAALQQRMPSIRCHIFSAGPHFTRLIPQAIRLHVSVHDLVPSTELAYLYKRSSVQVIPQSFGTGDGSLPSKLPNLLAAGVPIFAICEPCSELGSLVHSLNAGAVSNTWDINTLVDDFLVAWPDLIAESHFHRQSRLENKIQELFSLDSLILNIIKTHR